MFVVKRIDEDIDFGCEERAEDVPVMAVVTLEAVKYVDDPCTNVAEFDSKILAKQKSRKVIRMEDDLLYQRDINEGDEVCLCEDGRLLKPLDYIKNEVHRLYHEHDTNCARTTMHCLGGLMGVEISEQTWAAAVGMHGAGGFRAQCGLVEGGLMFLGIFCSLKGYSREEAVKICYGYGEKFTEKFGSLRCLELRPGGFREDDPPHLCEKLTCEAIQFSWEYVRQI